MDVKKQLGTLGFRKDSLREYVLQSSTRYFTGHLLSFFVMYPCKTPSPSENKTAQDVKEAQSQD